LAKPVLTERRTPGITMVDAPSSQSRIEEASDGAVHVSSGHAGDGIVLADPVHGHDHWLGFDDETRLHVVPAADFGLWALPTQGRVIHEDNDMRANGRAM